MADSKREQILANVATTLAGITTANGFNFTVKTVTRKVASFSQVSQFPHINIFPGPGNKNWDTNYGVTETFRIGLNCFIKGSHKPGTSAYLSQQAEKLAQDLDNAILADIHRGHADFVDMTRPVLVEPYVIWEENIIILDYIFEVDYHYDAGAV